MCPLAWAFVGLLRQKFQDLKRQFNMEFGKRNHFCLPARRLGMVVPSSVTAAGGAKKEGRGERKAGVKGPREASGEGAAKAAEESGRADETSLFAQTMARFQHWNGSRPSTAAAGGEEAATGG